MDEAPRIDRVSPNPKRIRHYTRQNILHEKRRDGYAPPLNESLEEEVYERKGPTGTLISKFVRSDTVIKGWGRPLIQSPEYNDPDIGFDEDDVSPEERPMTPPRPVRAIKANIQEKGGSQLQLINHYRRNVLQQAHQSFLLALIAAGIGLVFFISAVSFLVLRQPETISITSLISGSLVEVISGINFYLYGRTSRQLDSFHMYLDRTCRFMASESTCEHITNIELRDRTLSKLILGFMEIQQTEFHTPELENSDSKLPE